MARSLILRGYGSGTKGEEIKTTVALGAGLGLLSLGLHAGCAREGPETMVLPAGTQLAVTLDQSVTTGIHHVGDPLDTTVKEPVVVSGRRVIPAGVTVRGAIVRAVSGDQPEGPAMTIAFTQLINRHGNVQEIETMPFEIEGTLAGPAPLTTPGKADPEPGSHVASDEDVAPEIELPVGHLLVVEVVKPAEIAALWSDEDDEGRF